MYYCIDCGEFFEEPAIEKEDPSPAGVSLPAGCYTYQVCPHCGSDMIEEAEKCEICGEYFYDSLYDICSECRNKIVDVINDLAEKMAPGDVQDAKDAIVDFIAEAMYD